MDCSVILVHVGEDGLPWYLNDNLRQLQAFNPDVPIHVVVAEKYRSSILRYPNVSTHSCESLSEVPGRQQFDRQTALNSHSEFRNNFWRFATERFFFIAALMRELGLKNVVHLENDTLLYASAKTDLVPKLVQSCPRMGGVMMNDEKCVPCFVFIKNSFAAAELCSFVVSNCGTAGETDMDWLSRFPGMTALPTITPDYVSRFGLANRRGDIRAANVRRYTNNFELFQSVFDGAAFGQKMGGVDPRNIGGDTRGFVNEDTVYDTSRVRLGFQADTKGRHVPFLTVAGSKPCRINTLHIHSKQLSAFLSLSPAPYRVPTAPGSKT